MKNWEKYEKEIKAIGIFNLKITKDGRVVKCENESCSDCIFNDGPDCIHEMSYWLYKDAEDTNERD